MSFRKEFILTMFLKVFNNIELFLMSVLLIAYYGKIGLHYDDQMIINQYILHIMKCNDISIIILLTYVFNIFFTHSNNVIKRLYLCYMQWCYTYNAVDE